MGKNLNWLCRKVSFIRFAALFAFIFLGSVIGGAAESAEKSTLKTNILSVPLTVSDAAKGKVLRIGEPVTTGVPLPESAAICDDRSLQVVNAEGLAVPAQFKVLSRWHGKVADDSKPIKWVLVDFQSTVPASGAVHYKLEGVPGAVHQKQNGIKLEDDGACLVVDTGAAQFKISHSHFNLLDQVWVKKRDNVRQLVVDQPSAGGVVLVDGNGKKFSSMNGKPVEVTVENAGPLRAVVKIRDVLTAADGSFFAPSVNNDPAYPRFSQPYPHSFVFYNCRIIFYSGKGYVRIFFTLENNGANGRCNPEQNFAPIQMVYFDSLSLFLNLNPQSTVDVSTENIKADLGPADQLELYQGWREAKSDFRHGTLEPVYEKGIFYGTTKNNHELDRGLINPGWFDIDTGNGIVSFAMRDFWQNFPKKITITRKQLIVGLWPSEGYYPHCRSKDFTDPQYDIYCRKAGRDAGLYLFDAGRHKTYEMMLGFYPSDSSGADLSTMLNYPLMAVAEPSWYADSGALGLIAPAGVVTNEPEINEAIQRFELLQAALVEPDFSENRWTIETIKRRNPPHWSFNRQDRFFGWMHYGDLLWAGQSPCSLHYDWPYSMLLHYLRTGNRQFFDTAAAMAKHRYDIDQYHGGRTDKKGNQFWRNYMAFYETDAHADPSISRYLPSRVSKNSHTWNGGLVLYYLLTGDVKAWEAAVENGHTALNYYAKKADTPSCAVSETRQETWPMLNLINLYRVNGNPEYLRVARNLAKNRLLYREQQAGGSGRFGSGNDCDAINGSRQANTMYAYAINPLIQIHYETRDEELAKLLIRMADFTRNHLLFGGDVNNSGEYRSLQSLYIWLADDPEGVREGKKGEVVKDIFWADLFAYAYRLTGDQVYLEWARKCFRDGMFYYTASGSKYFDPKWRAKISFKDGMFSGSETKVHGWLGCTGQVYLNTEYMHR